MNYGLRKGLEDIAAELKGIRTILGSMWHSRYKTEETDLMNPELYADEYISTEECAKRLGISDQTIRNWIAQSKSTKYSCLLLVLLTMVVCNDT
jgi:DNA invertase Pin-like site-specific DNA recombinase